MLVLPQTWLDTWLKEEPFGQMLSLPGQVYRQQKNRRTLRFMHDGKAYFVKIHLGVGWKEIVKNLLYGRLPILSASNEWRAILRLEQLGIPTMHLVGYGCRGWNPAALQSFLITEELTDTISLEDYCRDWQNHPPAFAFKVNLIKTLAIIARTLHQHGVNHRDFYLCHFLLSKKALQEEQRLKLYVIDLHRAQLRRVTPRRWIIKDLSSLYFSAMDTGLSKRDLLRFIKHYTNASLRTSLNRHKSFWHLIQHRADNLYCKTFHQRPHLIR